MKTTTPLTSMGAPPVIPTSLPSEARRRPFAARSAVRF